MDIIIEILMVLGLIYLFTIPFNVVARAIQGITHMTETQSSIVVLSVILFFVVLTIIIGIIDIVRSKHAMKHHQFRKLKTDNQILSRKLEGLRGQEEQMSALEQESYRAAADDFSRNRAQMEQNVRMIRSAVRRNKLCELLSSAGSRQADQMIIRDNRGGNMRKQYEHWLAEYDKMCSYFSRS